VGFRKLRGLDDEGYSDFPIFEKRDRNSKREMGRRILQVLVDRRFVWPQRNVAGGGSGGRPAIRPVRKITTLLQEEPGGNWRTAGIDSRISVVNLCLRGCAGLSDESSCIRGRWLYGHVGIRELAPRLRISA